MSGVTRATTTGQARAAAAAAPPQALPAGDAGVRPASTRVDAGLLVLRLFAGLALALAHGINKLPPTDRFVAGVAEMGFPAPGIFAWAAGLAEFGGGFLLALGLLARPAAFFVVVTMAVAAFVKQAGDPFTEREAALLHGCVALCLLIAGPGRLSLDALMRARRDRVAAGRPMERRPGQRAPRAD